MLEKFNFVVKGLIGHVSAASADNIRAAIIARQATIEVNFNILYKF